ncbi:hypothetical protein FALBO_12900 [Fusarium albosuccineum]|uniref:Uncharacterized protein n=1 Tax=Fusarium albosuccineum TaxID=1237068 RepID=A0A8H4P7K4_9HYPO|nr:hypothetical protein FALBO_12900 [Fusarium albosuccineum]
MDQPLPKTEEPVISAEAKTQPWQELMQSHPEHNETPSEGGFNGGSHLLRFAVNNKGVCDGAADGYGG